MFLGLIPYSKLIFLCCAVFLAGFIDSIAGGGGVISIPAYLLSGLDPKVAFGCSKTSSCLGTTLAAGRYIHSGAVNWTVAVPSAIGALVGARIASLVVLALDPVVFQKIILFVLPFVAVFLIFKRDFGERNTSGEVPKGKMIAIASVIGVLIAFYDGLVGPGTGTFAIIAFCSLCKLDLKTASGSAKVFNWASNFASMVSFLLAGKVIWAMALTTAVCSMAGNFVGSGMAIKKNPAFIRVMLTVVCTLLLLKLGYDVLIAG